jgi:hypothetical protein
MTIVLSPARRPRGSVIVRRSVNAVGGERNLTHTRSLRALIIENVWLPNKCLWRNDLGIPRSDMTMVT